MSKSIIAPTTEIVASIATTGIGNQAATALQSDPRGVIAQATGLEIEDNVDVSVVANTDKTVNLVLPYYDVLDENPPAIIEDADMANASGGWYEGMMAYLEQSGSILMSEPGQPIFYGRNYTVNSYGVNNPNLNFQTGGPKSWFWERVRQEQGKIDAEKAAAQAAIADAFSK